MFDPFILRNKRYSFFKVLWVVLAIYLFFILLGVSAAAMVGTKELNLHKLLSLYHIGREFIGILFVSLYFFYTLNQFNRYIIERKHIITYVQFCLVMFVVQFGYMLVADMVFPPKAAVAKNVTTALKVFSYTISGIFSIGFSLLIAYLNNLRDEKKQRKILEAQKLQLEIEKSQANLNFLKAQINPHFLHNTLNFLYAKALPLSEELSEGILTLSDIMRYALSEANTNNGRAMLKEEIEHVRNVIKINQLRFSNNLQVNMEVVGTINGAMIIPFVLITLVENAFKHGDVKSAEHPIDVKIEVEDKKLYFYCRNKKKTGPKELGTGVGLDNIKKRLELAYANNHSFHVKDEVDFYTTELTIQL